MLLPYDPQASEPFAFEIWFQQWVTKSQFAEALELLSLTRQYLESISNLIPDPDTDLMHSGKSHAAVKCLHRLSERGLPDEVRKKFLDYCMAEFARIESQFRFQDMNWLIMAGRLVATRAEATQVLAACDRCGNAAWQTDIALVRRQIEQRMRAFAEG